MTICHGAKILRTKTRGIRLNPQPRPSKSGTNRSVTKHVQTIGAANKNGVGLYVNIVCYFDLRSAISELCFRHREESDVGYDSWNKTRHSSENDSQFSNYVNAVNIL